MSDKIREAFDVWIASIDKRRDANGWEPLTARDVNMLREGYMEAALAQQPAQAVHEEGDADNAPWMSAATEPAIAWRDGWDACRAAMLAAAPAAPVAQEPVAWVMASDIERLSDPRIGGCAASMQKTPRDGFVAIYTAPPAAEQTDTVPVPRKLLERWASKLESSDSNGYGWEDALADEMRALLAGGEA